MDQKPLTFRRHDLLWLNREGREAALGRIELCVPVSAGPELVEALIMNPEIPAIAASQYGAEDGFVRIGFSSPTVIEGLRLRVGASAPLVSVERRVDPFEAARIALQKGPFQGVIAFMAGAGSGLGAEIGLFGSSALEAVTGLAYTRESSDVDLYIRHRGDWAGLAVLYQALLDCETRFGRRLDAELEWPDGSAAGGYAVKLKEVFSGGGTVLGKGSGEPVLLEKTALREAYRSFADEAAAMMTKALLYEAACDPKPGLVTRTGSGSHQDMDFFTFIDSAAALTPFFRDCCLAGFGHQGEPEALFPRLRELGKAAEERMFQATGGVNTHKGVIFSGGILCAAAGYAFKEGALFPADGSAWPNGLLAAAGSMAAPALADLCTGNAAPRTGGERSFANHGLTGIRGEAAAGFPSLGCYGYPALKEAHRRGHSLNDAGAAALLRLIAHVEDTNIIARGGVKALEDLRREVSAFLENGGEGKPLLIEETLAYCGDLDRRLCEAGLSPGGSADLLALGYFLVFLEGVRPPPPPGMRQSNLD